jgi:hypothetical protein
LLSVGVWLVVVALLWQTHGALLSWDEVDYLDAAKLGVWANATDAGSLSPGEFVRFSLAKRSGRAVALPPGYDEERDPLLVRHYHPPFVV